ncbi:hypothetical protein ACFL3M_03590 [Patescibacteria group bacterium]
MKVQKSFLVRVMIMLIYGFFYCDKSHLVGVGGLPFAVIIYGVLIFICALTSGQYAARKVNDPQFEPPLNYLKKVSFIGSLGTIIGIMPVFRFSPCELKYIILLCLLAWVIDVASFFVFGVYSSIVAEAEMCGISRNDDRETIERKYAEAGKSTDRLKW